MAPSKDERVRHTTRQLALGLLPDLPELSESILSRIRESMPELSRPEVFELGRAACEANCTALLYGLVHGATPSDLEPGADVIDSTRELVQHGVAHEAVIRTYHLGTSFWSDKWAWVVGQHCDEPALAVAVLNHGVSFLLSWLEVVVARLTAELRDETERVAREGSLARVAFVRQLLDGDVVDIQSAGRRLGYDLTGPHTALVLTQHEPAGHVRLEGVAHELARGVGTGRPLFVHVDAATMWCWVPTPHPRKARNPPSPVRVGQGEPAKGLAGFRRSHHEAGEALRVARLAGTAADPVTRFGDVELATLCSRDVAAVHHFLESKLGDLLRDTGHARRLAETLRVYYQRNSNARAAAAEIGVHHNTVRYRLERTAALLGHPIDEDRLATELALHLAARLRVL